ncbi:MAG: hypothetical protein IPK71_17935 [Myxococcales bacterium]|nr:hypothetical protein [Myxococcales bacterium]
MKKLVSVLALAHVTLAAFALTGCAADTSTDDEVAADAVDAEDTGTSEEALSSTGKRFVGTWNEGSAEGTDFNMYFSKLVFGADGRYTAEIADPRIRCIKAPCVLTDSGTWNGYTYRGDLRVRLTSTRYGRRVYQARIVTAQASLNTLPPERLVLTRNGTTVSLAKQRFVGCEVVRCTATTHCDDGGGTKNAACVPNTTCAAVRCAQGTTCDDSTGEARCVPQPACRRTGCSGQVCADRDMMTTCEMRPEYACYRSAVCERGADGQCGFRKTAELTSCLANAGN